SHSSLRYPLLSSSSFFFFYSPATPSFYSLSLHDALPIFADIDVVGASRPPDIHIGQGFGLIESHRAVAEQFEHGQETRHLGDGIDRKSTRLNSSHVSISYAVFCLKKKTSRSTHNVHM